MEAVVIEKPGGPQALVLKARPQPLAGAGEVLIRVMAAGVNRPDVLQRKGQYPPPEGVTDIPGLEVSGVVQGGDLSGTGLVVGAPICALLAGGGYAQYAVAPVEQVLPIPRGLSWVQAASLPESYFTVWSNVFDRGRLNAGESLLVQGGASGIGVAAIQLASSMGHTVFATAGSDEKCQACEQLGAARAINYRTHDFSEVLLQLTHGRGVDVILDMVAADYVPRELACLALDGRLVVIATQGGRRAQIDVADLMVRRLTVTGSTLRARSVQFKGEIAKQLRSTVWPLFEQGRIKPVIHQTFALHEADQAHALMESDVHIGKIVLRVDAAADQVPHH